MTRRERTTILLMEKERVLLHDALAILSPDDPEASEQLEVLVQSMSGTTASSEDLEMEFRNDQMELAIAALDVINPDDDEAQVLAETLAERFRVLYFDHDEDMSNEVANVDSFG